MQRAGGDAADKGADIAAEAQPRAPAHQQAADARGQQRFKRRPGGGGERLGRGGRRHGAEQHAEVGKARCVGQHRAGQRLLVARPLPEIRMGEVVAERTEYLGAPNCVAVSHAPGMAAGEKYGDAQQPDGDAADDVIARRQVIGAAPLGDGDDQRGGERDARQCRRQPAPRAEIVGGEDRIDAAERQERRQRQAAEDAADDEEQQRDQHASRAAADSVERAGAAAIGELHADAEGEGADQERRTERRDGAAEIVPERGDRYDRQRADGDHDQPGEQPARLPARQEAPPGRGVAELGFQKRDAEAEAADDQRRRSRLSVEQHQRDQNCGGDQSQPEEQAVDAEACPRVGRAQGCGGHRNSPKTRLRNPGQASSSDRPTWCATTR